MSRMSPPPRHSSDNSTPTRGFSLDQAIRDVSWDRGLWYESQRSAAAFSPPPPRPHVACRSK